MVVGLQIGYPLAHGAARNRLTVAIVLTLAAAAIAHVAATRGAATAAAVFAATALPGFAVEVLGVHTGVPFGDYRYATTLGPRLFGVPLVIALAWTMLAVPAAIVAPRVVRGRAARVAVGAWALAGCDVFLDPQLVHAGAWTWHDVGAHLPGVPQVPLTNFGGWLLVALVLSPLLQSLVAPTNPVDDRVAVALYLWLYVGWIVALAGFLGLAAGAGWGALAMGTVAVPVLVRLVR